jgi:hypothetical protein
MASVNARRDDGEGRADGRSGSLEHGFDTVKAKVGPERLVFLGPYLRSLDGALREAKIKLAEKDVMARLEVVHVSSERAGDAAK